MSLLPMLFSEWWEELDRPHQILDQHFGLPLIPEELPSISAPLELNLPMLRPRRHALQRYRPYERNFFNRRQPGASIVKPDKNKFEVTLDVAQFAPEEVSVKVVNKAVIIEAKHEEKQDEHGWISRQFVRKYLVPEQCDIDQVKSTLSSDGILTILAPRKVTQSNNTEKIIQIQNTGQPALKNDVEMLNDTSKESCSPMQKKEIQQRGLEKTAKVA